MKYCLAVFLCTGAGSASALGFSSGNSFTSHLEIGTVKILCPGVEASYQCRRSHLSPNEQDVFAGENSANANSVTLTVVHADGTHISSTNDYDGINGFSLLPFNLWTESLLELPLLKAGKNSITYILKNDSAELSRGEFKAQVEKGDPKSCATLSYQSADPEDCQRPYWFCEQYFNDVTCS